MPFHPTRNNIEICANLRVHKFINATLSSKNFWTIDFMGGQRVIMTNFWRHLLLIVFYLGYLFAFALLLQFIERPNVLNWQRRQRLLELQQRHRLVIINFRCGILNYNILFLKWLIKKSL